MDNKTRIALTGIVVLGLLCAFVILSRRVSHERRDSNVEIVVDYRDLKRLAPVREGGITDTLKRARAAGAVSVAVHEERLSDFEERGQVLIEHGLRWNLMHPDRPLPRDLPLARGFIAQVTDPEEASRLNMYLTQFLGSDACFRTGLCIIPYTRKEIEEISLGFTNVPDVGLRVSLRPFQTPLETSGTVELKFEAYDRLKKPGAIVFSGTSVTGYPNLLEQVAREINNRPGLRVGMVEMVEQDGIETLARLAPEHIVQVHSITEKEMLREGREGAVRRMLRAARERRVQVLYLTLFTRHVGRTRADALEYNLEYIRRVAQGLRHAGLRTGPAQPMQPLNVAWFIRAPVICAAFALVFLLAGCIVNVPGWAAVAACVLLFPAYFVADSTGFGLYTLKLSALFTACFVPGLAISVFFLKPYEDYDGPGATMPVFRNIISWLQVCVLTATGGLMIAAIMSQHLFFARLQVFAGVKLALVFPMLVVLYAYLKTSGMSVTEFFNSPFRYAEALACAVALAAVAVYLMRSGNDPAASAVAGSERGARDWLEAVFTVRPRTKEFLLGHPAALLIGLVPFSRKHYGYVLILLAAAIGQASLINTFCHLHTPLGITVVRVVIGMALGAVIGLALRVLCLTALRLFESFRGNG